MFQKGVCDSVKKCCVQTNNSVNSPIVYNPKRCEQNPACVNAFQKNHVKKTNTADHSSITKEKSLPDTGFQLPLNKKFQSLCDLKTQNQPMTQSDLGDSGKTKSIAGNSKKLSKQKIIQNKE